MTEMYKVNVYSARQHQESDVWPKKTKTYIVDQAKI